MHLAENHGSTTRHTRNIRRVFLPPFAKLSSETVRNGWEIAKEFADFPGTRQRRQQDPVAAGSTVDRLENLSTIFFQNDQNRALHQILEDAFTAKARGAPALLLITGDTQTGKTRALHEFLRDHPPVQEQSNRRRISEMPALYVPAAPPSCSIGGLEHHILDQFYPSLTPRITRSGAIDRIAGVLRNYDVELLIIDNAEIFNRLSNPELSEIANLFHRLVEEKICGIVLAGEVRANNLLNRLGTVAISEFHMGNFLGRETLPRFIQQLCENLPLPCAIDQCDAELLELIQGIGPVGSAISVFKAAATGALAQGAGKMLRDHLVAAAADRQWQSATAPTSRKPSFPLRTVLHASRRCLTQFLAPHPHESIQSFEERFGAVNPHLVGNLRTGSDGGNLRLRPGEQMPVFEVNPPQCATTRFHLRALARITTVAKHDLAAMAAVYLGIGPDGRQWISFMGQLVDSRAISLHLRWCPVCWRETPYLRNIWRLAPLKICLEHQIWLETDKVGGATQWNRACIHEALPQKAGLLETIKAHNILMAFRRLPKAPLLPLRAEFVWSHPTVLAEIGNVNPDPEADLL